MFFHGAAAIIQQRVVDVYISFGLGNCNQSNLTSYNYEWTSLDALETIACGFILTNLLMIRLRMLQAAQESVRKRYWRLSA